MEQVLADRCAKGLAGGSDGCALVDHLVCKLAKAFFGLVIRNPTSCFTRQFPLPEDFDQIAEQGSYVVRQLPVGGIDKQNHQALTQVGVPGEQSEVTRVIGATMSRKDVL